MRPNTNATTTREEELSSQPEEMVAGPDDLTLKGNKLYFPEDTEIGSINGGVISIRLGENTVSFAGSTDKIIPGLPFTIPPFMYDGLLILDRVAGPYNIYKPLGSVNYKCDGPLLHYNQGDSMKIGRKDIPYFYCETDGKSNLSQYEFSATRTGFATGDIPTERWYKLYIKRINDQNVFFIGDLDDDEYIYNTDTYVNSGNEGNDKYKEVSSRSHLDKILQMENNKKKVEAWDNFVQNIK